MERTHFLGQTVRLFKTHPVVALLGPRQCGKTTLARKIAENGPNRANYFDLEDPTDLARLESPKLALESLSGLIVIDEVQRRPDLFPVLRVLVDQRLPGKKRRRFLLLGSASRDLLRQSSETLAGRIAYLELPPFTLIEDTVHERLWLRGGFPRSYLARSTAASLEWRKSYITTYLERDIPALGINIPPVSLRRFWLMLTHYHGQTWNAAELGSSLGISDHTARRYLDILAGTFMIRLLTPWYENIGKRQVKAPKLYIRDSGILHSLMGVADHGELLVHPKLGASWEGFAMEQVLSLLGVDSSEAFFWAVHGQAELDLFVLQGNKRRGFEFKYTDAPALTRSMEQAREILKLDELLVIYPGDKTFPLHSQVRAVGLSALRESI
jgi:predicted AAA+ superfamily ATPase